MIRIRTLPVGPIATNCYVVSDDEGNAFVIDPGYEYEPILEAVKDFRVSHILLTHAHFDHIGGVQAVKEATGALVLIHELEADWLVDPRLNLSAASPEFCPWEVSGPPADRTIRDGEVIRLLSESIEARHTPGHSPGHVSYVMGDVVFGGDALFYGSVGRTDLPGGDGPTLIRSIRERLLTLPPGTSVLPGHGPPTSIGEEAKANPFLQALR